MSDINKVIEIWKENLLDVTKRNRLINYKDTKRSSIRLMNPSFSEIWNQFVEKEKPLYFFKDDEDLKVYRINENGKNRIISITVSETNKENFEDLEKALRNLKSRSKTISEEQGVNVLYLAFGFVNWKESPNSTFNLTSPLLLVPVKLQQDNIYSPFVLEISDDEISINPTLTYKFETDFGIKIPEYDQDINFVDYLNQLEIFFRQKKMGFENSVALSIFPFLKINMYKDLIDNESRIKKNQFLRALAGEKDETSYDYEEINDSEIDEKIPPQDCYHVLDADFSQLRAILMSQKNTNFVIKGPPGTGKSQTITNIISQSIANGKRVLFVSEKMAALEVVRKRIDDTGLSDFCLTLHSHRAKKKEILEELGNVVDKASQKYTINDDAYRKLNLLQHKKIELNDYSNQVHEIVKPLGKSLYDVFGELAKLDEYESVDFDFKDIAKITPEELYLKQSVLSDFAQSMTNNSDINALNPWEGSNIRSLSFEMRTQIEKVFPEFRKKNNSTIETLSDIFDFFEINSTISYNSSYEILEMLKMIADSPLSLDSWVLDEDILELFDLIKNAERTLTIIHDVRDEIIKNYEIIAGLDSKFKDIISINRDELGDYTDKEQLLTLENINEKNQQLRNVLSKSEPYSIWKKNKLDEATNLFDELSPHINNIKSTKDSLLKVYEKEIFQIDHGTMLKRFKTEYSNFLRIFKRQYWNDRKTVMGLRRDLHEKTSFDMVLTVLLELQIIDEEINWLESNQLKLSELFGEYFYGAETDVEKITDQFQVYRLAIIVKNHFKELLSLVGNYDLQEVQLQKKFKDFYQGRMMDWGSIQQSLNWTERFQSKYKQNELGAGFVYYACSKDFDHKRYMQLVNELETSLFELDKDFNWYKSLFEDQDAISNMQLEILDKKIEEQLNNFSLLEDWIDFQLNKDKCRKYGLGEVAEMMINKNVKSENVIPIFRKRFYRLWLDAIIPKYPAVEKFRRSNHETIINEFADLDKLQFIIARDRIKSKLHDKLPSNNRVHSGNDELSILKRELTKKRRIKPIRKLFREIPNLLLTLKPCLMMSPLSVSLFLNADNFEFDIVIFDEASQVKVENAIGAILRGKQVIIAGDKNQLPPTNFFTSSISDSPDDDKDDDDYYDDVNSYESILDIVERLDLPSFPLLWHYRSKHEHLIAFSNLKIYRKELITFPSNIERLPNNGVEYIHVKDGIYLSGLKRNLNEANRVGELVFEHFKNFKNRSLGVIAFGSAQQQAIEDVIRKMRKNGSEHEKFFNEECDEPFFVKNLENVQGDERDTIILSIGYAKGQDGKFSMFFGPLSNIGGERRLNVAITRARYNLKLVGSIHPTDIDTDRISNEGPKLLRAYIEYAKHGPSILNDSMSGTEKNDIRESPFEEAVYSFLTDNKIKVSTQVGCSGYRIDLAVRHPAISGQYSLGIECDGAMYHSGKLARERDRLRQDVLENMGWKIYRIWSTDWIKDSKSEGEKLLNAINDANKVAINNLNSDFSNEPISSEIDSSYQNKEFIVHEESIEEAIESENYYGFEEYVDLDINSIDDEKNEIPDTIKTIRTFVRGLYPLHIELLCRKVGPLFNQKKATNKFCSQISGMISSMPGIYRNGDYLYPSKEYVIKPRVFNNNREIKHINYEEIAEAMFIIVTKSIGMKKEDLLETTTREYGFKRSGSNISIAMENAYQVLKNSERIIESKGKVLKKE